MANKRVSELAPITVVDLTAADLLLLADVTAHESKKLTLADLSSYILSGGNLTGSLNGTASWAINTVSASFSPPTVSSSFAISASTALRSISSSYSAAATSASYSLSSSFTQTASYVLSQTVASASFANFAGLANSASFLIYAGVPNGTSSFSLLALTASFALNGGGGSGSISSSFAATSSQAQTSSYLQYNVFRGNGTASLAIRSQTSDFADSSTSASHADVADIALVGITTNFQSSASWASSSISASYAQNATTAVTALTASFLIGDASTTQYGVFTAITQSITSSQVDVVTLNSSGLMTASFDVKGTLTIPFTASVALSESVTLHLLNRTTGVDQVLDMTPIYYFVGNTSTFVGTISGSFIGSVIGTVTGSVIGSITGSTSGTVTGSVNGQTTGSINGSITGSITGSISGSNFGTGSIDGSVTASLTGTVTGSVNGTLTGSFNGQSTGSINGVTTGSISGSVTGSMNGIMTGTITNQISGSFTMNFGMMASSVLLADDYMLYVTASSNKISFSPNRLSRFGVDVNIGTLSVSVGEPLAFYTDNPDFITFFSLGGGPFVDTATNMAITGSDQILQVDLSGVNGGAHNVWTMTSMFYISGSNATGLTSVSGMPSSLLTMSFQTSSLSSLKRLDNTSIKRLYVANSSLSRLPLLPDSMSNGYINCSQNAITTLPATLPVGLKELYCDANSIVGPPASFPSSVVSMSFSSNTNLSGWLTTLPSSLVWFWVRDNPSLVNLPTIPPLVKYLDASYNNLSAVVQDSSCADLVTNGLLSGSLDIRGNAALLPVTLTRIATLQSRAWTVQYV